MASPESGKDSRPRIKLLPDESEYKRLPDLDCAEYVADMFHEIGRCKTGAMSIIAIEWVDIMAFSQFNYVTDWEASMIKKMSEVYVNAVNRYKTSKHKAPYCEDYDLADSQIRDKQLDDCARENAREAKVLAFMKSNNLRDA